MTSASPSNLLAEWSWLLVDSLARAGITDVILSPGSRSTPFVLAASRHPGVRCRHILDERSAAFFALGQAKVRGRPSLLLCTSGTAGANYLPAVVEAKMSHTPLLALTADRPIELMDCSAPQTIDQVKLFGDHVRHFVDLGPPDPAPRALRALRRAAAQAVYDSLAPAPGAVHLNARVRKPLEPQPARGSADRSLHEQVQALTQQPLVQAFPPRLLPDPAALQLIARTLRQREHGLIACGPAPLSQAPAYESLEELARLTGYPLLVEATSQLRFVGAEERCTRIDAFDAILRSSHFRARHPPEVIIQVGQPPTSRAWETYLEEHPECELVVLAPYGWNDPTSSANLIVTAEIGETARALCQELADLDRAPTAWREDFASANRLARRIVERELEAQGDRLSEGGVAHQVVEHLAEGSLLALGNSLPVRQVDTYCPAGSRGLGVWCQRGANGIDGLISGAAGAASVGTVGDSSSGATGKASSNRPVTLLVGDVSFLHDLSGLVAARNVSEVPLVVVAVHNDGGRIFEQLPIAQMPGLDAKTLDHWLTPHGLSLEPAARLVGAQYRRVDSVSSLAQAMADCQASPGLSLIEAVVPPHGARKQNNQVWNEVDAGLREASA